MATQQTPYFNQNTNIDQSAIRLTSDDIFPNYAVLVKALAGNAGKVYLKTSAEATGGATGLTTSTGYELSAGQEKVISIAELTLGVDGSKANAKNIWLIASQDNQGVCYEVI